MVGFYNYTVWLTYISLAVSSLGISFAVAGHPLRAVFCLIISGVCDLFDGKIARTRKKSTPMEKAFGIQIDSLTDIVCFGVLPAAIGYCTILRFTPNDGSFTVVRMFTLVGAVALVLCAMIRLAYFNVTEEERRKTTDANRTSFIGVPVTTSSLVFPLFFGLFCVIPGPVHYWLYSIMLYVTALGFIAPIRVPKPRTVGAIIMCAIGVLEILFLLDIRFHVLFF